VLGRGALIWVKRGGWVVSPIIGGGSDGYQHPSYACMQQLDMCQHSISISNKPFGGLNLVRVNLVTGNSSIEVDGSIEEVLQILETYWAPTGEEIAEGAEPKGTPIQDHETASTRKPAKKRTRSTGSKGASGRKSGESDNFDEHDFANKLKTHPLFANMQRKALNLKGKWIEKGKCICLVAEEPIHTGHVRRVLQALKLQASAPRLSEAFSRNNSEFLTSGSNPVLYEFTAPAREEFEKWLEQSDE